MHRLLSLPAKKVKRTYCVNLSMKATIRAHDSKDKIALEKARIRAVAILRIWHCQISYRITWALGNSTQHHYNDL